MSNNAPGFLGTVLLFSLRPVSAYGEPRSTWSRWPGLLFACVAELIGQGSAALTELVVSGWSGASTQLIATVASPMTTLLTLFAHGAVIHILLRLLRVQGSFGDTVAVMAFASGPSLLAGIPWAGPLIAFSWSLVLTVIGLSVVHGTSKSKAAVAIMCPPVALVALAIGVRVFVMEAFKIPSRSMSPTLEVGDHIMVSKRATRPGHGEPVVFAFPEEPSQDFVKRVIARGGDEVRVVGHRPVINGWQVPRCRVGEYAYDSGEPQRHQGELFIEYLGDDSYFVFVEGRAEESGGGCESDGECGGLVCFEGLCEEEFGPYHVPADSYFVLGDNRANAYDSRGWGQGAGGSVPPENIRGTVRMIWASFDDSGRVRWNRVGTPLRSVGPLHPYYEELLGPRIRACLASRPSQTIPPPSARGATGS